MDWPVVSNNYSVPMKLLFLISKLIRLVQAIRDNVWEPRALLFRVWSINRRHHSHLETCEEMRNHRSQSRLDELESDSKQISRWVVGPLKLEKHSSSTHCYSVKCLLCTSAPSINPPFHSLALAHCVQGQALGLSASDRHTVGHHQIFGNAVNGYKEESDLAPALRELVVQEEN